MLSLFDQGAYPPCPAPFNLAAHVLAKGSTLSDKIALQILRPTGAERWSYARLIAAVRGVGTGLLRHGLQPGARVLLRLGNTSDFPVAFLACIAAGLVPVPSSAQLTVPEITGMAAAIAPVAIIAAEGIALPDPLPCPVIDAARLADMADLPPCPFDMGDPGRLAYIIFTSGSTGRAQAVGHAHRAIWARGMMHDGWEGLTEADRLLHAGAFNWTYTLGTGLLDPWTVGATALIPGDGVGVPQLPLLLKRFDATIFAAAPGVFRQMLRVPFPALPRLRHGLSAGESLPVIVRENWRTVTGTDLHEALGMSECSTFISGSPLRPAPAGSTGYPQKGRRIAVLGDDGPVSADEAGILAVSRGDPGLFLGYVNDDAETSARFRGEWFLTGDTVSMAADGAISYLGRVSEVMNAGGYRVSPLEVEAALAAFPGLTEVAVAEIEPSPGATIIAAFFVAPEDIDQTQLSAFAQTCLARYKQPRSYTRVQALPRNANGKLDRRALSRIWRPE